MNGVVFGCVVPHPPLLVPDIGRGQESAIAATREAMLSLATLLAQSRPDSVVIISPHGPCRHDAMGVFTGSHSRGDMSIWRSQEPARDFDNDSALAGAIVRQCHKDRIPVASLGKDGYELDHGAMVPLHFLAGAMEGLPLLPVTFSWLPLPVHFIFGHTIKNAAVGLNRRLAIIASGDLSHRLTPGAPAGYDPLGKTFDEKLVQAISQGNTRAVLDLEPQLIEHAGECGLRSIVVLLGALEGSNVKPQVLSYEGPFGVGYMVASFQVDEPHPLALLAREAVESCLRGDKPSRQVESTPEMQERAGVFVCIKKAGDLRGCIGTFEPVTENVAQEISSNAVSSATRDPRFPPVTADELPYLEYTVDVLTPPELVESIEDLDPRQYGIIVQAGNRKGLLLPDLEGVDTARQQIDICRQKASIGPNEPVKLYRFQVRRYK